MYINRVLHPYQEKLYLTDIFLPEKSGSFSFYPEKAVDFTSAISNSPCLILLGESGTGKTEYLKNSYLSIEGENKIWVDLKKIANEKAIDDEIFNATFEAKYNESEKIYLFLDALDETLIDFNKFTYRFLARLKKYDYNKIILISSCRGYYFPQSFETDLKEYFHIQDNEYILYNFLPLKRSDVEDCIKDKGILDEDKFFEDISKYNLRAFLPKPLTLLSVIELYKNQRLSGEHSQIFSYLIKNLLEETNTYRKEQARFSINYKSSMTIEQKLYISARIAFYLITRNRSNIFIGQHNETPETAIHISEIEQGIDELSGEPIELSKCDLGELLITGLFFTSEGLNYSFVHKSYMDFLSAWYIHKQDISLDEKLQTISVNGNIIPILSETCGWLALLEEGFFNKIVTKNAHLLLKDSTCFNDEQNKLLIEKAVQLLEAEKISVYDVKIYKLVHSGLREQIKNFIQTESSTIKLFCIKLISQGKLYDFETDLFNIANNWEQPLLDREEALIALSELGSIELRKKLYRSYKKYKDFLDIKENDADDSFRASYLYLLLSIKDININKILKLLSKPKRENFYGRYKHFLRYFIDNLNENTIYPVLKWAIMQEKSWKRYEYNSFFPNLLKKSVEFLHIEEVAKTLADIFYKELEKHHFTSKFSVDNILIGDKNSKVIFKIIVLNKLNKTFLKNSIWELDTIYYNFLNNEDFIWLCNEYKKEINPANKSKLKLFIEAKKLNNFPSKLTNSYIKYLPIYEEFNKDETLSNDFGLFDLTIYPEPPAKPFKSEKENSKPKVDPIKIIEEAILLSQNDINQVINIIRYLTIINSNGYYGDVYLTIEKYPVWQDLSIETQNKILGVFLKFLKDEPSPNINEYLKGDKFQYAWFVLAFIPEMLKRKITTLAEVKPLLNGWVGFVFLIPNFENDYKISQKFTEFFFDILPNEMINSIKTLILHKPKKEHPDILNPLENINNLKLNDMLFSTLQENITSFSPQYITHILKYLLVRQYKNSLEYAHSLLEKFNKKQNYLAEVSATILSFANEITWDRVYLLFSKKRKFKLGRTIIANFMRETPYHNGLPIFQNITQETLADYYIWLYKAYPYEEEEKTPMSGFVGESQHLRDFRRILLNKISSMGATIAVSKIQEKLPETSKLFWFNRYAFDVYNNRLLIEWSKRNQKLPLNKNAVICKPLKTDAEPNMDNDKNIISVLDDYSKLEKIEIKNKNELGELAIQEEQINIEERERTRQSNISKIITVYVEAKDDEEFYNVIYNALLKKYDFSPQPKLNFVRISDSKDLNGGYTKVISRLKDQHKQQVPHTAGLIDKDKDNHNIIQQNSDLTQSVKKKIFAYLKRYSIENYYLDPVIIYAIKGTLFDEAYRAGEENFIEQKSSADLQEIANKIFKEIQLKLKEKFGDTYVPQAHNRKTCETTFVNNKKIKYPNWFFNFRGKDIQAIVNDICGRNSIVGKIKNDNWAVLVRMFNYGFIPTEFVEVFQKIQDEI